MRFVVFALIVLSGGLAQAAVPAICQPNEPRRERTFEIGLQLRSLMPNKLPGFTASFPGYGPVLGIRLFDNTLQLQSLYGEGDGTIVTLTELGYRIDLPTPFFNSFTTLGAHYLHYAKAGTSHDEVGGNVAIGLAFAMGRNFELSLSLKAYVQSRTILSFGGGFSFLI